LSSPVDPGLISVAAEKGFSRTSDTYQAYLKDSIIAITENMGTRIHEFIEYLIGSFLFNINPSTGKKYLPSDVKTIRFIAGAFNIFTHTHSTDINILKTREILNEMLSYSQPY
jgi:hypothetical protein